MDCRCFTPSLPARSPQKKGREMVNVGVAVGEVCTLECECAFVCVCVCA